MIKRISLVFAASLLVTGCLTGGKVVSPTQQEDLGLITIDTDFPGKSACCCSGVLLANDWALTAGHCLDVIEGKTTRVITTFSPISRIYTADAVYKFGSYADDPGGPDIGLVHIATPIPVHGQTTGFVTRFWTGVVVGKSVSVFGSSTGSYLAAEMAATATPGRNILVGAGPNGETTAQGDSGGPGIIWDNGTPFLIGIVSATGPPATLASIPAHHRWIVAVTQSQWFPGRSTSSIDVELDEINATPWSFAPYGNQLERVPWALAQRAATTLCMNRGMAGGHFEGTQNASRVSLQCSKRTNVVFKNDTQSDIDTTVWKFSDINTVPWAQANRAAERLCATANPGYAGGHFSGQQVTTVKGRFCFGVNAARFDSTDETRARANASIGNLDAVTWAEAARSATRFCQHQGATSGFFNGHQVGDKKGVVCLR